jgi:membrane dipeptidase
VETKANSSAQIISPPPGGRAMHGLGETFSREQDTGTDNFTMPIARSQHAAGARASAGSCRIVHVTAKRVGACILVLLASCMSELERPGATAENQLAHAEQLQSESPLIFSHDHVRDTGHFQHAINGGVTAMTLELMVDNLKFVNQITHVEVFGPLDDNNVIFIPFVVNYPYESTTSASARFHDALTDLQAKVTASAGQITIVRTVEDIDAAKVNGRLGIIIGTEGTLLLADNQGDSAEANVAARVDQRYADGWRKATIFRQFTNPFAHTPDNTADGTRNLTLLGRRLIPQLNKRGVVVDVMHLHGDALDELVTVNNAPLQMSHEWGVCSGAEARQHYLDEIVASGGGHGVISVNVLGSYYNLSGAVCENGSPAPFRSKDVNGLAETLVDMVGKVGVDHVGIGPDYQPSPDTYTLAEYDQVPSLILALLGKINPRTGLPFSDADIKKILGENLRELYQRVWDPTHGYDGGAAHFTLCSDSSSQPDCVAARSNRGQGDLRHRAINCAHPAGLTPVGTQLQYVNGQWNFKNLNSVWVHCAPEVLQANGQLSPGSGSTLVISWGDGEPQNGRIALSGTAACDALCQQASNVAGAGTTNARALSCVTPSSNGVVGLQLVNTSGGWNTYNIVGQLTPCTAGSTLVADWSSSGVPNPNANARLCDDRNSHPACAAAASNGGNGTEVAKAVSCLGSTASTADFGAVALQVFYQDVWEDSLEHPHQNPPMLTPVPGGGHWQYWGVDRRAHPCVHGTVVVATTLSQ